MPCAPQDEPLRTQLRHKHRAPFILCLYLTKIPVLHLHETTSPHSAEHHGPVVRGGLGISLITLIFWLIQKQLWFSFPLAARQQRPDAALHSAGPHENALPHPCWMQVQIMLCTVRAAPGTLLITRPSTLQ